jgi:hypothetical protein
MKAQHNGGGPMAEPGTARAKINAMLASLQTIEGQLARGDVRGQGLEDLKMGVDDLRLRIWAVMAAATSGESGALERFRLRRAIDVLGNMRDEIISGAIDPSHPEVATLKASAQRLLTALESVATG